MQLLFGLGLQSLGQLVEHVGRLVDPAALLARGGIDLRQRLPEAQRSVAGGQLGIDRQAAGLHVQQQRLPRLLALAIAVGDGDQLLLAVGRGAHQHQDALPIFFQADVEVDAVGPHVDVLLPVQGPLGPLLEFSLPDFLEPGDRRSRQARAAGPTSAARASLKSPVLMPLRYSQGISSSMLLVFRRYGGRIFEEKGSASSPGRRSSTRGCRTSTGPTPVRIVRSGR